MHPRHPEKLIEGDRASTPSSRGVYNRLSQRSEKIRSAPFFVSLWLLALEHAGTPAS